MMNDSAHVKRELFKYFKRKEQKEDRNPQEDEISS